LGVDPLGEKLRSFYPPHIELLADFFSAEAVRERVGDKKARVITSVAMFYDLPQPLRIVEGIASLLADDGIWISEQSYLPAMIEANAYDTICHEHVEYYGLRQFQWMAERCGLKIVDVELNDINGGSFSVTLAKSGSTLLGSPEKVQRVLASEDKYAQTAVYAEFEHAVQAHRDVVRRFFADAKAKGQTVLGLGASTKGNVLLQYCGLTAEDLPMIGEVNPEKFGCVTPGSHIPIVAEEEMRAAKPDVLFVLPWHFKPFFIEKERSFLEVGGKLCFPLPNLHVVDAGD
jgi:NDP-4-keto-2,6-dideoxyhexose 3-C-methyltransferase